MTHTNTNRKAPNAQSKVQGAFQNTNAASFRTGGAINQALDSKAIATQIARLTLAGHTVHKGIDGDFLVCKYGLSRWCQDFAELAAFALKLGVHHE